VLVALMGALLKFARVTPLTRDELTALCCAAHRRLQGGSGSGIDVATAVAGGVISIEPSADGSGPRTSDLAWPDGLHMLAIWSGNSASTPAMLARLQGYRQQQAEACDRHMTGLADIAARTLSAWQRADITAVLATLDSYATALDTLDQHADIGIYSGGHAVMREIARAHGAVYKPSGAGGGDFGLALTGAGEILDAVTRDFLDRGYHCLKAGFCAPGLAVSAATQPT
jgi:mevalonate kinase